MAINYWAKFEEEQFYHIYNRSLEGLQLFNEHLDYVRFITKYKKYFRPYFDTVAYALIPNHFHFIVRIKKSENIYVALSKETTNAAKAVRRGEKDLNFFLEDQMRRFFSSYALSFNRKYNRRGPVFSERPKRVLIHTPEKLNSIICYVHHNPIHHNLSKKYQDWKYSSYNSYFQKSESFVNVTLGVELFGNIEAFTECHRDYLKKDR